MTQYLRNFVLLNKIFVRFCSTKFKPRIKLHQCSMSSRVSLLPSVCLLFSTIAHCTSDKNSGDKKRIKQLRRCFRHRWASRYQSVGGYLKYGHLVGEYLTSYAACISEVTVEPPYYPPIAYMVEPKALTHEYLIRQACSVNVDAATQLLTLTVAALLDLNKDYRETLQELISLTEESLQTISMTAYQEDIWDKMIESRAHMEDLKKSLLELTSFMEYVEKVATSAAEASYLGGADYSSTAMCERINSAHQQLHLEQQKTKGLEDELLLTQESYVKKATSFSKKGEDREKVEKIVERKIKRPTLSQIIDGLNDDQSDS